MGRLNGKNVLITGATSGIGEAIATLFAEEGATVVIVGRNEDKGIRVVKNIVDNGGIAEFAWCDVLKTESVKNLRKEFEKKYSKLDILVNNAGILITDALEDIKEEDWELVFDTNVHSVMRVTQCFIDLIEKSKGNILNNTSIDGLQSLTRGRANYAYCASKAAAVKFTQQLALNYTPKGVRVNCLCPGVTDTPFFTNKDYSRFINAIPMGRIGKPDEIAKAALFLVSDDASYISGTILTVDGGASLK